MRRNTILILLTALCMCLFFVSANAEECIENGGFESTQDGAITSWKSSMWISDYGVSFVEASEDAYEGNVCAMVENCEENDARFEQTVAVNPDTLYRISCMVKAQGCGEEEKGATISIKDTMVSSVSVYDTDGEWVSLSLYGRTGENQTELVVMARVGGYSSTNTGKAWFDNFSMVEVESVPEDAIIYDFSLPGSEEEEEEESEEDTHSAAASILLNGIFVLLAAALILLVRNGTICPDKKTFLAALGTSFVLRLVLSVTVRGYSVDMTDFMLWARRICETKPWGFYSADYFCDYPPGYMWVLYLTGSIEKLLNISYDTRLCWLLTKLPAMLCDMGTALLLTGISKEKRETGSAYCIALLYAFCPAVFLNSAAWGQMDGILSLLLVLAIVLVTREKWHIALPVYALSVTMKPQALMFGPIALFVLILRGVQAAKKGEKKTLRSMILGIAACFAVLMAVGLPFVVNLPENTQPHGIAYLFKLYSGTMTGYRYFSVNGCSLYTLLGLNWTELSSNPALAVTGFVLLGLCVAYSCFLLAKSKGNHLFLVCAVFLAMAFALSPMMHERYLFPVLALVCAAYAVSRDKRIVIAGVVCAFTLGMNEMLVLQYDYLLGDMQFFNGAVSCLNVANALLLAWCGFDLCVQEKCYSYIRIYEPQREQKKKQETQSPFRVTDYRMNFTKRDALLLAIITVAYSVLTFCNLGSLSAPQSGWTASASDETVTFDLGSVQEIKMTYYGGICTTSFDVEYSEDGITWTEKEDADYGQGEIFRWKWHRSDMTNARYVRLTAHRAGLLLYEVAFLDADGNVLPIQSIQSENSNEERYCDTKYLVDEQDTVPPVPSWYNSSYFDEIYHARTGYELLQGESNYEWTHPPLGKMFIMWGISLFGMTPFGWRFAGALSGVLMLPAMYLLCKQLFKRSDLSFFGTFLLAVDCMHFTQTRIATIDTFVVLFIMLEYLFMFRYMQMSFYRQHLKKTLLPLALSGICMGLGIACKWTGIYAGMGLAVLFFFTVYRRIYEAVWAKKNLDTLEGDAKKLAQRAVRQCGKNICLTLLWCVVMFVIVPALIYYFSYYRQMQPEGGLSIKGVWQLQVDMFNYHNGLSSDTHFFRSPWYEWPLIIKPMWYYSGYDYTPYEIVSSISCMGNPLVWWGGLAALLCVLWRMFFRSGTDRRAIMVGVGFLAQYLPWILVSRSTFIYHYFTSVPFIILSTVLMADVLRKRMKEKPFKWCAFGYMAVALALFVMFYPLASGCEMPRSYAVLLRWFNWYNFS